MSPRLIALYSSVMCSGKSEVAQVLVEERGYKLHKFAGPLKAMTRAFLEMTGAGPVLLERMLEGDLKDEPIPGLGRSTRYLFQTLGTEWGRHLVDQNVWVNLARKGIREDLAAGQSVVIDDMRFPNEYSCVVGLGGIPVRVYRPSTLPYSAHPSEAQLDKFSMVGLHNGGTLADLREVSATLPERLLPAQGL